MPSELFAAQIQHCLLTRAPTSVGTRSLIKPAYGSSVLLLCLSVPVTRSRQERPRQFGSQNTPTWAQQEMKTWKSLVRRRRFPPQWQAGRRRPQCCPLLYFCHYSNNTG